MFWIRWRIGYLEYCSMFRPLIQSGKEPEYESHAVWRRRVLWPEAENAAKRPKYAILAETARRRPPQKTWTPRKTARILCRKCESFSDRNGGHCRRDWARRKCRQKLVHEPTRQRLAISFFTQSSPVKRKKFPRLIVFSVKRENLGKVYSHSAGRYIIPGEDVEQIRQLKEEAGKKKRKKYVLKTVSWTKKFRKIWDCTILRPCYELSSELNNKFLLQVCIDVLI